MLIKRVFRFLCMIVFFTIYNFRVTMIFLIGLYKSLKIDGNFKPKFNLTYYVLSGCYVICDIRSLKIGVKL